MSEKPPKYIIFLVSQTVLELLMKTCKIMFDQNNSRIAWRCKIQMSYLNVSGNLFQNAYIIIVAKYSETAQKYVQFRVFGALPS